MEFTINNSLNSREFSIPGELNAIEEEKSNIDELSDMDIDNDTIIV